ncbi:MAG: pyroglutamyl-peptidase I [Clostridia bacterium]|nr:pyroglutamyl-peptidase I [Clostridia bacterium]
MSFKRLLITGFDPFGGESVNPSYEAVKGLPDIIGEYSLTKACIPTKFGAATEKVIELAEKIQPHAIICVGQAGSRGGITPEVIGINLRDASIPDNGGYMPKDEKCVPDGQNAFFSTLPVKAMVNAIKEKGIPASLSYTAGTFVCNDLLYTLLHRFEGTDIKIGFIHVPFLPSQAKEGVASMPLTDMVIGLEAAILAL